MNEFSSFSREKSRISSSYACLKVIICSKEELSSAYDLFVRLNGLLFYDSCLFLFLLHIIIFSPFVFKDTSVQDICDHVTLHLSKNISVNCHHFLGKIAHCVHHGLEFGVVHLDELHIQF